MYATGCCVEVAARVPTADVLAGTAIEAGRPSTIRTRWSVRLTDHRGAPILLARCPATPVSGST